MSPFYNIIEMLKMKPLKSKLSQLSARSFLQGAFLAALVLCIVNLGVHSYTNKTLAWRKSLILDSTEEIAKYFAELNARQGHGITLFYHLHKAAGTTLCAFARKNGKQAPKHNNCNVGAPEHDQYIKYPAQFKGQEAFTRLSLAQRKRVLADAGYNFASIEYFGPSAGQWFDMDTDPQIVYVTAVRHPVERMVSQYFFMVKVGALSRSTSLNDYLLEIRQQNKIRHVDRADNLMVRQLAGREIIYSVPPLGITSVHLNMALKNLRRFSVVLITEQMGYTASKLESILGWTNTSALVDTKVNAVRSGSHQERYLDYLGHRYGSTVVELLMELNAWDMVLYYEIKRLYGDPNAL